MNIYVASSWRCKWQPYAVEQLRAGPEKFEVYDFRNPAPGNTGFRWSDIDPDWQHWSADQLATALSHPIAVEGFRHDAEALARCDACVLVLPCGRSAHLELGWAIGAGKIGAVYAPDGFTEPELMYKFATAGIHVSIAALIPALLKARITK